MVAQQRLCSTQASFTLHLQSPSLTHPGVCRHRSDTPSRSRRNEKGSRASVRRQGSSCQKHGCSSTGRMKCRVMSRSGSCILSATARSANVITRSAPW